jgi:transposase-like protein/transposase
MPKAGPPNKVALALAEMEACTSRVNVAKFARLHEIPESTLRHAWKNLRDFQSKPAPSNDEFASNLAHHLVEARGRHTNRSLTDEEELRVVDQLMQQFPHGFTDRNIKRLCHLEQHESRQKSSELTRTFITAFKERRHITRSKFVARTRKLEDPINTFQADVRAACEYLESFDDFASKLNPHLIINIDETPAYVKNTPSHANHFANSSHPWQWIRASSRLKVTVLASITAAGTMLKPTIVAKGKTKQCETNFAKLAKGSAFLQHTESGLTTSDSFVEFIENVIAPYTNNQPSLLILDQWQAHLTEEVRICCASHNISMLEVPARGTAVLQPLNVGVFGVAKKKLGADYKAAMFLKDWTEDDKWESTIACVRALLRIDSKSILRGWQLAFPGFVDELKKRNMEFWVEEKPLKLPM